MAIFTKLNGVRALLGILVMLVLNILLNYIGSENTSSSSKLSMRQVHKYAKVFQHSKSLHQTTATTAPNIKYDDPNNISYVAETATKMSPSNVTALSEELLSHNFTLSAPVIHNSSTVNKDINNNNSAAIISTICKDPSMEDGGPITPNTTLESLDVVEAELGAFLKPGGFYQPIDCIAKYHVAIIVPFRDRYAHLSMFLRNIHPFLMKQRIAYRIFIVEQTNGKSFNRAALMNIGFLEALKFYPWDCFIFHDVDLLPLDDRNLYNCPRQPRHMSVAIDTLNFKLPYRSIFGGVSAMTREHFQMVNGFSNLYFGWGGEDDDMSNRLKHANLFISRYPINIARYQMLKHQKEKANPKRYEYLVNGIGKMEMDGINSIKYEIYSIKEFPTFTWYLAELKITEEKS